MTNRKVTVIIRRVILNNVLMTFHNFEQNSPYKNYEKIAMDKIINGNNKVVITLVQIPYVTNDAIIAKTE